MRSQVKVSWSETSSHQIDLEEVQPMPHEQARIWLDQQFTELECDPIRLSGKVLTADKVLVVTQAAGAALLSDAAWAARYTQAVSAALGKPMIQVDVPNMAITY